MIRDKMNYEITNVTTNAQYIIQVILHAEDKDENIAQRKKEIYALTPVTSKFLNYVK